MTVKLNHTIVKAHGTQPLRGVRLVALVLAITPAGGSAFAAETTAISEHYQLRPVSGSLLTHAHWRIFVRTSAGSFGYLASVSDPHWAEKSPFGAAGLVAKNIAVSTDGRSLVYQHIASLAGRDNVKESGLYHYAIGAGETLLLKDKGFSIPATRYPRPLPQDALVIRRMNVNESVTADGVIAPLLLLGGSALHRAAMEGDAEAIARLGSGGAEALDALNHWDLTALDVAVLSGQGKAALQLLALGAKVHATQDANALIFHASAYRSAEVVDELLRRKVPYQYFEEHGVSPFHALLHFYLEHGLFPKRVTDFESFAATLDAYLRHGADISYRDGKGRTLLHLAPHSSVPALVRGPIAVHLIGKGIDVDAIDHTGSTALHYAAEITAEERSQKAWEEWKLPALRAIAEKIKSVDVKDAAGLTPLQRAVQRNQIRTADYLVSRGADASGEFVHAGLGPKIPGQTIRARIDAVKESEWWNYK